ncbi:hypothetical protein [Kribbella sindirgiensis]|uniref:Uncharacterized protein n=1 Tax=Kribbella sindirgiensis TaxID=1124744 RepID=A0A4R0I234_9ACTN|nr:hypothetical protein [Kribbella sindirgiensis]TCC19934.1 hypothetical protein E0H50_37525 [Kribbella sindirgiensis]
MAKAKVKYKKVRGALGKKTGEQETRVVLDLSENEALFLADLLMYVGGCTKSSRRRHADSIKGALDRESIASDTDRRRADFDGRIYLADQVAA